MRVAGTRHNGDGADGALPHPARPPARRSPGGPIPTPVDPDRRAAIPLPRGELPSASLAIAPVH